MDVTQINNSTYTASIVQPTESSAGKTHSSDTSNINTPDTDTSYKVDISDEGRLASLQAKEVDTSSAFALKVDESILSAPGPLVGRQVAMTLEQRENMNAAFIVGKLDPFDNPFQVAAVRHNYTEGTLEKFISDSLDGKAQNSTLVAQGLAEKIKSAAYGNGATVEERAINREIGMQNARYIAETYFDNPDEAKAFMDEINRFYEKDILREKGYIAPDNSDAEPYKSYLNPPNAIKTDGNINSAAIMKHFGASDEILADPQKRMKFMLGLDMRGDQWQKDIADAFDENEEKVTNIIDQIKASALNDDDVMNSLARILKAF